MTTLEQEIADLKTDNQSLNTRLAAGGVSEALEIVLQNRITANTTRLTALEQRLSSATANGNSKLMLHHPVLS
jgi:phage shock protein A